MLFVGERRRSKWRPGAIRARDVRAADLQEKPTKRVKNKAGSPETVVSLDPTKTAATQRNIAASGASHQTQRAQRAKQSNSAVVDCTLTGSRQFTSFVTRQQTLRSSRNHPDELLQSANGCPS
jgi:hypothetical protein